MVLDLRLRLVSAAALRVQRQAAKYDENNRAREDVNLFHGLKSYTSDVLGFRRAAPHAARTGGAY
jgi:hypothetical protein